MTTDYVWYWLADRFGFINVDECKAKVSNVQFEGWKAWFGLAQPGGLRGPEDELMDVFFSRLMYFLVNSQSKSSVDFRKFRIFPPPYTEEDHKMKIMQATEQLRMAFNAVKKD